MTPFRQRPSSPRVRTATDTQLRRDIWLAAGLGFLVGILQSARAAQAEIPVSVEASGA